MTKPIIAVDIDDVIADTTEALRLVANKIPGVDLTRDHYLEEGEYWGYYESVWARNKVGHLVSFDKLHDDMAANQSHVKLIDGARLALELLSEKYKIILITSREVEWVDATKAWVKQHVGDITKKVVFVHHITGDRRAKGDACREIGAKWLIDDNYEHCQSAQAAGVSPILFGNYGWNSTLEVDASTPRAKNWGEVLEYFDGKD